MKRGLVAGGSEVAAKAARVAIDVERVRQDTRGLSPSSIFLNSAGSSLPPAEVVDAQIEYLKDEELHGGYAVAEKEIGKLECFYTHAAKLLGCSESEVAFAESATRAWTLLFHSLRFAPGDRIITSASDYGANFVSYLQAKERWQVELDIIPDDSSGQVDMASLREAASHEKARLISLNHVPTAGGVVQPAREIGAVAKEFKVPYLLDACQSVGQLQVDVTEIGCDMLTATGRKFLRGPRGSGFLYVRQGFRPQLDPSVLDHIGAKLASETSFVARDSARCFEQYECCFAAKAGLAKAISYALQCGMDNIEARVKLLSTRLREGLRALENVTVTDSGRELCGIVTFKVEGYDVKEMKAFGKKLEARGICITVCSSQGGSRIWYDRRGLSEVVRASPHYYNTEEEMDRFVAAVREIVHEVR